LGPALLVEDPDWEGARLNGERRSWRQLRPAERLCLVTPEGQSPLVGLQSMGKPFVDWSTAFRRTSVWIRQRYESRFPTTASHRLRHSMAMATLERLIKGFYRQAAALVTDAGDDAAMALYLLKSEPMLVLRDLLGHQSVLSTALYVARLDVTRIRHRVPP
jgi:integrase